MFSKIILMLNCIFLVNASVSDYLSKSDFDRYAPQLVKILVEHETNDFVSEYYSLKSFKIYDYELPLKLYWDSCAHIDENFNVKLSVENTYHALTSWNVINCDKILKNLKGSKNDSPRVKALKGVLPIEEIYKRLSNILEDEKSTIADIRYALESLILIKKSIPAPSKVAKKLQTLLKSDDSLQSYGHILHAASLLKTDGSFALQLVEDVIVQADEVDGKFLQWEGGLTTTSSLITGLLRLPGSKPFTQSQADKLAAYLMSRKFVQSPKGILALIEAVKALTDSSVPPICVTYTGSNQITTQDTTFKVKVSDLLGKPYTPKIASVVAQSATRVSDDVVVMSKQPFLAASDPTEFTLQLKLEPGTYKLVLAVGSQTASLTVHVLGPVAVNWLEVGLSDGDGSSATRLTKLQHPEKLSQVLNSDATQHLIVRFQLSKTVHQAFLRLYSGNQEIIFIAEQDSSKIYKIDVHVGAELASSGVYELELLLGDFSMSNKIRWHFGSLDVKVAATKTSKVVKKGPKPEIKHLFRPAEKRPPTSVSMLFTGLALAPLLLLFILWFNIGINVKNFTVTALPFHLGLASILGLFIVFWLKLNMFQTGALLIPLGTFTFLTGHKALKRLTSKKQV